MSSSIMYTCILVPLGFLLSMVSALQILSLESQSLQTPVYTHGVVRFNLFAFKGAATVSILLNAASTSLHTLFFPTITNTFLCPKIMEATLFPVPSLLTSLPSSVRAFELVRYTSEVVAYSKAAFLSSAFQCQYVSFPLSISSSYTPMSSIVMEPPIDRKSTRLNSS